MNSSIAAGTGFLEIGGKKIQLTQGGTGSPLIYLHSAAGEAEWELFHERLAGRYAVQIPAHPGFCLSTGLEQIDDIADMAWHYVDLFEQQGWRDVPVVGFSLGAWIALEMAVLRPQLISRLVIVAAAGLHVDGAPMAELFVDDFEALRKLLFFDPSSEIAQTTLPTTYEDPRMLNWLRAREATARVGWNPYLHNPKLPAHLHRVSCPVRVLWGRQDRLIPLAHGQYYAQHLPNAELTVLEDCGHMLPFEQPDAFAQCVLAHLG